MKSYLKPETESLICTAQEQALRTSYVKYKIDHTTDNMYRMCRDKGETVIHAVIEFTKLAQREYKRSYNNVVRMIHCELCENYGLERVKM